MFVRGQHGAVNPHAATVTVFDPAPDIVAVFGDDFQWQAFPTEFIRDRIVKGRTKPGQHFIFFEGHKTRHRQAGRTGHHTLCHNIT